jgi:hypothetical protein
MLAKLSLQADRKFNSESLKGWFIILVMFSSGITFLFSFLVNNVPSISGPTSMRAVLGNLTTIFLNINDADASDTLDLFTYFQPPTIPGAFLLPSSVKNAYTFNWTPQTLDPVLLRYSAAC